MEASNARANSCAVSLATIWWPTFWPLKGHRTSPMYAELICGKLAKLLNLNETGSRQENYESSALPTELRRPVIDSKWDPGKRKEMCGDRACRDKTWRDATGAAAARPQKTRRIRTHAVLSRPLFTQGIVFLLRCGRQQNPHGVHADRGSERNIKERNERQHQHHYTAPTFAMQ